MTTLRHSNTLTSTDHCSCGSEGEFLRLFVPAGPELCERLPPGVDVEDDLHRGDVYQGDQYADGQGEGAPDSAGLAGGRDLSRL